MKNERAADLLKRVQDILQELELIKLILQDELETGVKSTKPRSKPSGTLSSITDDELKQAYLALRQRFVREGRRAVDEFAAEKSASYLDRLIRSNNLSIPTKREKSETVEALVNYLARSLVIRGN